jgi:hypothetical protein
MIRTAPRAVLLIAMALASVHAYPAGELESGVKELFLWGEYDSLIRSLEPWLAANSAGADGHADSVELSRANLFLGVAYFATEKPALGGQAFARACRLDTSARLDRHYASPEIVSRFDTISTKERNARRDQAARAAAAGDPRVRKPRFAWKGWAIGLLTTVGIAAGTGIAYYALTNREDNVTEVPVGP